MPSILGVSHASGSYCLKLLGTFMTVGSIPLCRLHTTQGVQDNFETESALFW